jgi:type IV secretory pathway VirB3-like protein
MTSSVIHQSLISKSSIFGVNQKIFSFEIALFFIILFLKLYVFLIILPVVHKIFKLLCAKDELFIEIYIQYSKELDFWDPWDHGSPND